MQLIPAIDLKDGRCVRLRQGDFDTVTQVAEDPREVARSFREAGAALIHVVDLDGAKDGVRCNEGLVRAIVEQARPALIELGGGLRCMADLEAADALGVWRMILGSAAVENPDFVKEAAKRYQERLAVGVDVKDGYVKTHGWLGDTGLPYLDFIRKMERCGVATIIFTDISTDGELCGPPLEVLRELRMAVQCNLVASGGISSLADLRAVRETGVQAAIVGKALYAGAFTLKDALLTCEGGQ